MDPVHEVPSVDDTIHLYTMTQAASFQTDRTESAARERAAKQRGSGIRARQTYSHMRARHFEAFRRERMSVRTQNNIRKGE